MISEDLLERMQALIRQIKYYDYELHIRNNSIVSEAYYDRLRKELEDLENESNYICDNSPSLVIGCVLDLHNIVQHDAPMYSLKCAYNREDALKLIKSLKIMQFVIEPKIDGVALCLHYKDSICESAVLRGDGKQGENVLPFLLYSNIPLYIEGYSGEIRGEVYIKNVIENHRNIVAGMLRNKNIQNYSLNFVAYKVTNKFDNHLENLNWLSQYFEIPQYYSTENEKNALDIAESIWNQKLNYPIDGSVIKNINYIYESSNRYAKDAFSYKYANTQYEANIIDIEWNINRSGCYIPRCKIEPIIIDGATIQHISAHNYRFVKNNHLGKGARIKIERVSNIVPQYICTLKSGEEIIFQNCIYCNAKLTYTDIHIICQDCPERTYQQILYFFQSLNIKGLNEKILSRFKSKSLLEIIEIIKSKNWISNLNDQKVYNLISKMQFTKFDIINALGINGASKIILKKYFDKSIEQYTPTDESINRYIMENKDYIEQIMHALNFH